MADDKDVDNEFLDFFERLGPQCKSLQEMVDKRISEALGKTPSSSLEKQAPSSGSYLEKQNEHLLNQLLKLKGAEPLTQEWPGPTSEKPLEGPYGPPSAPPKQAPKQEPKKPFWR